MKTKTDAIIITTLLLSLVLITQQACKKDKNDEQELSQTDELIVLENVVEIDTAQIGTPVIEDDNYIFTDNGNLPEFKIGDIIVGHSGYGYMRKVTNISTQGGKIVLTTSQARLVDVIKNCNIKDSIKLTLNKAMYKGQEYPGKVVFLAKGAKISERGSIDLTGFQIYSGTHNGVEVTVQIDKGSINYEPTFTRELEIRWVGIIPELKHLRLSAAGDLDFTCDASIMVDSPVSLEKEKLVAQFYYGPFLFGPVPVFIVLSFNAGINANLDLVGSIGSGFDTEAYLEYGADYTDPQWSDIWEKSFSSNSHGVTWDLSGEADSKVYVSPEVGLLVAGVVGPNMEAVPYLRFDGNINLGNQSWNWDLAAGVDGNIGFLVQIFGYTIGNYYTTLDNWEEIIAQDNGSLGGTFTDPRDGQTYKTVDIGNQTWFAENLNYETTNSWWYDNSSSNGDIYGRLYDWNAAITACPSGWHLPSDDEWTILTNYLGGNDIAGGKMKEAGTEHWKSPNIGATNSNGFTGLPGGTHHVDDSFCYLGTFGIWWSATEYSSAYAWSYHLLNFDDDVWRTDRIKHNDHSVRCLRD